MADPDQFDPYLFDAYRADTDRADTDRADPDPADPDPADPDRFNAHRFNPDGADPHRADSDRAGADRAEDDLHRVRRALSEVEPEIDLARLYAESRARAGDAAPGLAPADRVRAEQVGPDRVRADRVGAERVGPARGGAERVRPERIGPDRAGAERAGAERVEILLREPGSAAWRPRSGTRRGQAFAWGAAAAAAAILAVSLAGPPVLRALPGGAPSTPGPSATLDSSALLGLAPGDVVARAAQATGAERCALKTRSTLGTETIFALDDGLPEGAETPKALPLDQHPLETLQTVSVATVLGLAELEGTDRLPYVDLGVEELDGSTVVRIGIAPVDTMVLDGAVTQIELLIDVATWLPVAGETWAQSDQGKLYVMQNEFTWSGCGEPSPGPTEHDDTPGS